MVCASSPNLPGTSVMMSVTVGCTVVVDTGVLGNLGERFLALPGTMGESELWLGTVERSELWLGTVKLGICMLSEEPRTPWVGWGCCTSGASWGSRTSAPRLQNSLQSPRCPGSSPSGQNSLQQHFRTSTLNHGRIIIVNLATGLAQNL